MDWINQVPVDSDIIFRVVRVDVLSSLVDDAPKDAWKASEEVKKIMHDNNIIEVEKVQGLVE